MAKAKVTLRRRRPRISSGFVFRSVFQDRPDLCAELIEICLGIAPVEVTIVEHERIVEADEEARAGRLDLYVVCDDGARHDVEVQVDQRKNEMLRARYYQSLMDVDFLKRGGSVDTLPRTVVLFICDFDPFDAGLKRYDCMTTVLQTHESADDGRQIVMLNARGDGDASSSLDAFLRYFHGGEVKGDSFVDKLNAIIDSLLVDATWREQYMTFEDELEAARWNAEKRGVKKGRERERATIERENALLAEVLRAVGRMDEAAAALGDPALRRELLTEFGIADEKD